MTRFARKLVGLICIVAVLFAQMALSAYACPMEFAGVDGANASVAIDADGRDAESPALCQKHCEDSQQNVSDAPSSLPPVSLAVVLNLTPTLPTALPTMAQPPFLQRATAPPLAIRHCCFRI